MPENRGGGSTVLDTDLLWFAYHPYAETYWRPGLSKDFALRRSNLESNTPPLNPRSSFIWSLSQQTGQYALQFVGSVVVARLLTPHEMGVFALAMAASFLVSSLRDLGAGSYLVREEVLNDEKIRTAFGVWIAISWTLGIALLLSKEVVAGLYDTPGIADVLMLVSISFFVTPFGQPAHALLVRSMRFDLLHHITLTSVVVTVATNITLAFAGFSYMALGWGMIAGAVVRSVLLICARPDHLRMLPSFSYWREVLNFGGWISGMSIVGTINDEGTKFVLGALINPAATALYERSLQLPLAIRMVITQPLGRVMFPAYSKMFREGKRIDHSFLKVASISNGLIWPPLFALGFLSVPVVVLVFGEQWRAAGEIMPLLIGARIVQSLLPTPQETFIALGKVKTLFWITVSLTTFGLLATAGAALYGLMAFAVVALTRTVISVIVNYYFLAPLVGFSKRRFVSIHLRSFLVAAISSIPAITASAVYGSEVPFTAFLVIIPASAAAWLFAIVVCRHDVLDELKKLFSSLRERLRRPASRRLRPTSDEPEP